MPISPIIRRDIFCSEIISPCNSISCNYKQIIIYDIVLRFELFLWSVDTMAQWNLEHRIFAYDCFVRNGESIIAVQRDFAVDIMLTEINLYFLVTQFYDGLLILEQKAA